MSLPPSISLTPDQLASIQYQLQHIHEDRRPQGLPIQIAFVAVASLAVVLRFGSRKAAKVPCKADDYVTLLGLL
ncbi:MAG: hypothetical protein M1816_007445 [Peltula sp. TS41687]|nr:MAG: hypothetical protein M1816_007445 [Peltula sp. TS41687]